MRERVLQLGGKMNIRSNTGGTTISISLPFEPSEESSIKGSASSSPSVGGASAGMTWNRAAYANSDRRR